MFNLRSTSYRTSQVSNQYFGKLKNKKGSWSHDKRVAPASHALHLTGRAARFFSFSSFCQVLFSGGFGHFCAALPASELFIG